MRKKGLPKSNNHGGKKGRRPGWVHKFQKEIYGHYGKEGRPLPWRWAEDPYHIFVSEVMLQQTQVTRVMGRYERFIEAFPDFSSLAEASFQNIYALWQGLGYNRRARALREAARKVMNEFGGELPRDVEDLVLLPGVGRATASAIAAFAFNQPSAFIETNIRRVYIYFFFQGRDDVRDGEILSLVTETLDRENPREWYYALMDYGSFLKKGGENPNRRSIHYRRQAPFEGSGRQLRGSILRYLSGREGATARELARELNVEAGRVREFLRELEGEGFLVKNMGKYSLNNF